MKERRKYYTQLGIFGEKKKYICLKFFEKFPFFFKSYNLIFFIMKILIKNNYFVL